MQIKFKMTEIKKETNKKTFVLMLSKTFLSNHPRKGELTYFIQKYLNGSKKHTLRGNYEYWKGVIDQVNAGKAVLSIRCWSGKPYRSEHFEIDQLEKVGIEKVSIVKTYTKERCQVGELKELETEYKHSPLLFDIAKNDGLSYDDFISWFFPGKIKPYQMRIFPGAIIHFSDLRYLPNKNLL